MAQANYRQGLSLWREMHEVEQRLGIVKGLAGLAEIAAAQGQAQRAGRLFGTASRLLPATSTYREKVNRRSAAARASQAEGFRGAHRTACSPTQRCRA